MAVIVVIVVPKKNNNELNVKEGARCKQMKIATCEEYKKLYLNMTTLFLYSF